MSDARADQIGGVAGDENFAGMKPAVNETGVVRGIEIRGERAQARNQILERGGAELTQRSIQWNAIAFGRIRKWPGVIES